MEFTSLLKTAIGYAGNNAKRVFVLSIPDYSVTPFASGSNKALIASQIDSFNTINLTGAGSGYTPLPSPLRNYHHASIQVY